MITGNSYKAMKKFLPCLPLLMHLKGDGYKEIFLSLESTIYFMKKRQQNKTAK